MDIPQPWQFTGQDRFDWPDWVKGHRKTAEHMPYGPDGARFITCQNSNHVMLAPQQFWLTLRPNGDIWAHHPEHFAPDI